MVRSSRPLIRIAIASGASSGSIGVVQRRVRHGGSPYIPCLISAEPRADNLTERPQIGEMIQRPGSTAEPGVGPNRLGNKGLSAPDRLDQPVPLASSAVIAAE